MCRILVVDDEPIAVESVVHSIKKNFKDVEIVGTSRSGKDAIEKAYSLRPDIVIMDINMPGINGLEAMKQIRLANPNISFIVISAFDYFDYAVEAVTLGVLEYLLKPVKEVRLIEALTKVINEVNKNKRTMQANLELKERLEIVLPILETGFINSLCLFNDNAAELINYCQLFGCEKSRGYVLVLEFGQKKSKTIENKIGAGVQGEKMYGEYKKILKSLCKCIVGPIMLNRIIVYVFDESEEEDFELKTKSVRLAQNILNRAIKIYPDIHIGVGRHHKSVEEGRESYHEALYALRIITSNGAEEGDNDIRILHVDDIIEKQELNDKDYIQLMESRIYAHIIDKDVNFIETAFYQLFHEMLLETNMTVSSMKNHMISLVVGLVTRWDTSSEHYYSVITRIMNAKSTEELFIICNQYLMEVVGQVVSGRQKKVHSIIEKANNYIYENYSSELSLEDVAREVNLSPYYFSRFYKEESGINFTEMLAYVRIEKAKELLKKEEYSIKDVCYMVGYMEPNYFSKIFKKVTGVTASEYKKMYGL